MERKCENCEYCWLCSCDEEEEKEEIHGLCRRKAPTPICIVAEEDDEGTPWDADDFIFCYVGWPVIYKSDWCGEFKERNNGKEAIPVQHNDDQEV